MAAFEIENWRLSGKLISNSRWHLGLQKVNRVRKECDTYINLRIKIKALNTSVMPELSFSSGTIRQIYGQVTCKWLFNFVIHNSVQHVY